MAKKLLIVAHPHPEGTAWKLAEKFRENSGEDCEILDLYAAENRQDFLDFVHKSEEQKKLRAKMQEKISAAEEFVFFYPLRWWDAPAILKNWFDVNFTNGFAFEYQPGKLQPKKLLARKRARFFVTAGGPSWLYRWVPIAQGFRWNMTLGRMGFCGVKVASFSVFGGVKSGQTPEKTLEKMMKKVAKFARR